MAGKNRTPKEDGRARKGAAALPFAVDRRKPGSLVDQLADGLRQAILSLQERFVRAGYLFTRVSASDGRAGADRGALDAALSQSVTLAVLFCPPDAAIRSVYRRGETF